MNHIANHNSTALLDRLLDEQAAFGLHAVGRGTTNHLPMALIALARMGAPDAALAAHAARWRSQRAVAGNTLGISRAEWTRHIGDEDAFNALSRCFAEWLAQSGMTALLREVSPFLAPRLAGNAFHALIRLAFACEHGHRGEVAAGLAAMAASATGDLGNRLFPLATAGSVHGALENLAASLHGRTWDGYSISDKLQSVVADPVFATLLTEPPAPTIDALLRDLAQIAVQLYVQEANFTTLHLITATHAARVVFTAHPELATPSAIQALWTAFCAAYVAIGAPAIGRGGFAPSATPWAEITARAIASSDDHVIKLVYTCTCEQRHYGNPLYQVAALRVAGMS